MACYLAMVNIVELATKTYMVKHVKDLMVDTESYMWQPVKVFHAAWTSNVRKDWRLEKKIVTTEWIYEGHWFGIQ